jgi:glycerate 2-kinase
MTTPTTADRRQLLRQMYDAAVTAAHPASCVPPHLPDVPDNGRLIIIGAGKAAAAMAQATERHYAERDEADRLLGFVTTRHGYGLPTDIIPVMEAGHPVPDANSVASAKFAVQLAKSAGPNDLVLCLLSGGASALWSAPVEGVSFADKQALTKQLLRSGARISEMNCVRKHLSRVKGGGLASAAFPGHLITLSISDVPGDDPAAIGSGPTVADPSTLSEAREILERYKIDAPEAIKKALSDPANETLKPGDETLRNSDYQLVAAPKASIEAGAEIARAAGYRVEMLGDALEGEANDVGRQHAEMALAAKQRGERVAFLSGGEFTVTVRGNGSGGPNQEYALGLAIALKGEPGICAIAGDTDGIDGGGGAADDPAGAIVVPDTHERASNSNMDPVAMLANNDSTGFFGGLGDLLQCGPTQTNVNDFRAVLVDP